MEHARLTNLIILVSALIWFSVLISPLSFCEQASKEIIKEIPQGEVSKDDYLLSPSDEIEIKVASEDELNGVYRIDSNGEIPFPILGKVKVGDLTVSQVKDDITKLLEKDYFKVKVSVSVEVKKFHKRKATISGEVRKPASYEFEEDKNLSLVELITLAGGPTEKACMAATTIIRLERKGKRKTFKVKAGDIMEAKAKDIILHPGDLVNIPSANVIILGEVVKPGKYGFGDASKMTLLGAISMAGGFTRIAAINGINIIRVDEIGNKKTIRVKVNNIYNGREKDVPLEPDDIIVVPESWF